jgi:hypothetical protein
VLGLTLLRDGQQADATLLLRKLGLPQDPADDM